MPSFRAHERQGKAVCKQLEITEQTYYRWCGRMRSARWRSTTRRRRAFKRRSSSRAIVVGILCRCASSTSVLAAAGRRFASHTSRRCPR
jgi:hypothetical protein